MGWAGDVVSYPVQIRNNDEVWMGMPGSIEDESSTTTMSTTTNDEIMLDIGLKRNISLIMAKAMIGLSLSSYWDFPKSSIKDNTIFDGLK
ncbi:MAG: hypothetical protein ACRD8W_19140, partial [Nitrososphaeraceae archaeon]